MSKKQEDGSGRSGPMVLVVKMGAKFFTFAPKLFKILKLGKLGLAGASLASYTLLFSWQFALVIMGVLFIHEYTHVLAMKQFKMRVKGMYFIPFVGAAAVPEENFPSRKAEAVTAYAGPFTGLVIGLAGIGLYNLTQNGYVAAITGFTALISLFNLLPISPLDGGRVVKSVAMSIGTRFGFSVMIAALVLLAILSYTQRLLIFAILLPLAIFEFIGERRQDKRIREEFDKSKARAKLMGLPEPEKPQPFPALTRREVGLVFGAYLGLAVALFVIMLVMRNEPGASAAMSVLRD